jgi:hypothetical protein
MKQWTRSIVVAVTLCVPAVAIAGNTYIARAVGSGSDADRGNACSSATNAANMQVSYACGAGSVQGTQDQGCSCQCNPMGDGQICTCTDSINVTCEKFGK